MLRLLIKFVVIAVVLFMAYKAASIYALFKFADHMKQCLPDSGACRMAEKKAPTAQVDAAMKQALSCARQKQTAVESLLLPIPNTDANQVPSSVDYQEMLEMCEGWGKR